MSSIFEGVENPPPEWVGEAIRNYCGWHIAPFITETLTVSGEDDSVLILPTLRILDVTEIRVNDRRVEGYRWARHGVIYLPAAVRWGYPIEVDLIHGYEQLPAPVVEAARRLDRTMTGMPFATMSVDGVSVSAQGQGGVGELSAIDNVAAMLLDPYRRGSLP